MVEQISYTFHSLLVWDSKKNLHRCLIHIWFVAEHLPNDRGRDREICFFYTLLAQSPTILVVSVGTCEMPMVYYLCKHLLLCFLYFHNFIMVFKSEKKKTLLTL